MIIYMVISEGKYMAVKIILDAGHGGYDNGASYNGRLEKDDNLALTLAVGEILQAQGYEVEYTRTEDVYDSPLQKARIGNDSNADFFVSIHRNSSPTPNQYNGVQTLVYNDSGIKADMARRVNAELEKVGFRNINVSERPGLVVLRRTKMPAILIEAGFINSDKDNELFDAKFSEIAEAITTGIDDTIMAAGLAAAKQEGTGVNASDYQKTGTYMKDHDWADADSEDKMQQGTGNTNMQYQILIGIYRNYGYASYYMKQFMQEGYPVEIYKDDGLYQVRVGVYNDIREAMDAQKNFQEKGYATLIVRAN